MRILSVAALVLVLILSRILGWYTRRWERNVVFIEAISGVKLQPLMFPTVWYKCMVINVSSNFLENSKRKILKASVFILNEKPLFAERKRKMRNFE